MFSVRYEVNSSPFTLLLQEKQYPVNAALQNVLISMFYSMCKKEDRAMKAGEIVNNLNVI
jgi:hypothetical protein